MKQKSIHSSIEEKADKLWANYAKETNDKFWNSYYRLVKSSKQKLAVVQSKVATLPPLTQQEHHFISPTYNKLKTFLSCLVILLVMIFLVYNFIESERNSAPPMRTLGYFVLALLGDILLFAIFMTLLTQEIKLTIDKRVFYAQTVSNILNTKISLAQISYINVTVKKGKAYSTLTLYFYLKNATEEESGSMLFIKLYDAQIQEVLDTLKNKNIQLKYT